MEVHLYNRNFTYKNLFWLINHYGIKTLEYLIFFNFKDIISLNVGRRISTLSEQNKNRNKDKGNQKNIMPKYDTRQKREKHENNDLEINEESEYLNLHSKWNNRQYK